MIKNIKLYIILIIIIGVFSGCTTITELATKNNDFEYIRLGKVKKVNINNTRDKGFKFVVTDERAIKDFYDILSTAKLEANTEKSSLEPDYIFEFITQDNESYKFNYVAGLDKENLGNFYSDTKTYIVSKRIDSDVISSFLSIRRPKEFQNVYYNSILAALDNYRKNINKTDDIGIDLEDDVDMSKFILSIDMEGFVKNIKEKDYNASLIKDINEEHSILMKVKTEGYNTNTLKNEGTYKCIITFSNKKNNSEKPKLYYILDKYSDSKWNIRIDADVKPKGF